MSGIARLGDQDDGACLATPRGNNQASPNVFVDGIALHRVGDGWPIHGLHSSTTISGSNTVFANGVAIARVGDNLNCGAHIATGSTDVLTD